MRKHKKHRVAVAWEGLPHYAVICLKTARDHLGEEFPVIATQPMVPCERTRNVLENNLVYIEKNGRPRFEDLGFVVPDILFQTGWRQKNFCNLENDIRKMGGRIIGMFDNNSKGDFRQLIGALLFRTIWKNRFNGVFVPGISGENLMRHFGFNSKRIFKGLYAASDTLFTSGDPLTKRDKQIVFIGQFIERKGVLELAKAFTEFKKEFPNWKLVAIGDGPLGNELKSFKDVEVRPFARSTGIAEEMRKSRILALPSYSEHWGLVVHEATLSGCALLLSTSVGAGYDLANHRNSVIISKTNTSEILKGLRAYGNFENRLWDRAYYESISLSKAFSPNKFAHTFSEILRLN